MANGQATKNIVDAHDRLIRAEAKPFSGLGVSLDDLLQEARLALLECASTYDPYFVARREGPPSPTDPRSALWTYAKRYVLGAMFKAVGNQMHETPVLSDDDAERIEDERPGAECALLGYELDTAFSRALRSLSPDEQSFARTWLSLGHGSKKEITGMCKRTAERRFNQIVETLRERMGEGSPS